MELRVCYAMFEEMVLLYARRRTYGINQYQSGDHMPTRCTKPGGCTALD